MSAPAASASSTPVKTTAATAPVSIATPASAAPATPKQQAVEAVAKGSLPASAPSTPTRFPSINAQLMSSPAPATPTAVAAKAPAATAAAPATPAAAVAKAPAATTAAASPAAAPVAAAAATQAAAPLPKLSKKEMRAALSQKITELAAANDLVGQLKQKLAASEIAHKCMTSTSEVNANLLKAFAELDAKRKADEAALKDNKPELLAGQKTGALLESFKIEQQAYSQILALVKQLLENYEKFRKDANSNVTTKLQMTTWSWLADAQNAIVELHTYHKNVSDLKAKLEVAYKDPNATLAQIQGFEAEVAKFKDAAKAVKAKLDPLMAKWGIAADRTTPPATADVIAQLLVSTEEAAKATAELNAFYASDTESCKNFRAFVSATWNSANLAAFSANSYLESLNDNFNVLNPQHYIKKEVEGLPSKALDIRGSEAFNKEALEAAINGFEGKLKLILAARYSSTAAIEAKIAQIQSEIKNEQTSTSKNNEMTHLYVNAQAPQTTVEVDWNSAHSNRLVLLSALKDHLDKVAKQTDKLLANNAYQLDLLQDMSTNNGNAKTWLGVTTVESTKFRDMVKNPASIAGLETTDWYSTEALRPLKVLVEEHKLALAKKAEQKAAEKAFVADVKADIADANLAAKDATVAKDAKAVAAATAAVNNAAAPAPASPTKP